MMVTDLPDYEKRIIIVTVPGEYPGEVQIDHRKILGVALKSPTVAQCLPISLEHIADINHEQIKGIDLKDPTFANCIPSSIENDAIAYDAANDRFKVDIEKITATDQLDISDRAARLLGVVYGSRDKLQQRASTLELLAWINNFPTDYPSSTLLAALNSILAQLDSKTSTLFKAGQNIGNAFALESGGNLAAILAQLDSKTSTLFKAGQNIGNAFALESGGNLAAILAQLDSKTSTLFKAGQVIGALPAGTNNIGDVDVLTLPSIPAGTNNIGDVDVLTLPALPSGTNEIGSIKVSKQDATATPVQINITGLNGNSSALYTPASGKAIRLKFISIGHSADVDIGYRFGAAGTIYYMRITKGVYVSNLIGCNNQGAADAVLYLNSSGATDVKGYCLVEEV